MIGNRSARCGFTLLEMVISVVLLSLVLTSLVGVVVKAQKDYVRQRDVDRGQDAIRGAEIAITTALRNANADPFETGSALLDPTPSGGATYNAVRVKSDYNPADGDFNDALEDVQFWLASDTLKVRWQAGGSSLALAHPIQALAFQYYDSAGTSLTTDAAVDTLAASVKVTITADKGPRSTSQSRRESWVYLRN